MALTIYAENGGKLLFSKLKKISLIKDVLSLLVVTFFSKGMVFFINMLCAKFLTTAEFGQLSILRSTAGMLESLFSGTNGAIIVDEVSRNKRVTTDLIYLFIFYALIITIILFFMPALNIAVSTKYLVILTFCVTSSVVVNFIFIGLAYYSEQRKLTFISCIFGGVSAVILVIMFGLIGAVYAFIILPLVDLLMKFLFLIKRKLLYGVDKGTPLLIKKSFKYILIVAPQVVLFWWLRVSLGNSAIEELGLFEFLYQFISLIILMTGVVASVSIGKFRNADKYLILKQSSILNLAICFLFVGICFYYGNEFIILVNENYDISNRMFLFSIMLLTVFPLSFTSLLGKFFLANEKDMYNVIASTFSVLATVLLIFFISKGDIFTIVYSYLWYYSINFLILLFLMFRFLKIHE